MSASCCGSARKNAAIGVLSVAMLGVIGLVFEAGRQPRFVEDLTPPPVEMVEVLVAAENIPRGTYFSKENVGKLTTTKTLQKNETLHTFITDKNLLIGKTLLPAVRKGDAIPARNKNDKPTLLFVEGKDIFSFPMSVAGRRSHVDQGSRVDILASIIVGESREVFTLLPDMGVLCIDLFEPSGCGDFRDITMVSFAVDDKQIHLITQANQANCNLELSLRLPDAPKPEFDYDKTLSRLKDLRKKQQEPGLLIAPAPRAKGEQ